MSVNMSGYVDGSVSMLMKFPVMEVTSLIRDPGSPRAMGGPFTFYSFHSYDQNLSL